MKLTLIISTLLWISWSERKGNRAKFKYIDEEDEESGKPDAEYKPRWACLRR